MRRSPAGSDLCDVSDSQANCPYAEKRRLLWKLGRKGCRLMARSQLQGGMVALNQIERILSAWWISAGSYLNGGRPTLAGTRYLPCFQVYN